MKHQFLMPIFICSMMMIFASSCERADLQKSSLNNTERITQRDEDCNCPNIDDCCCSVTYLNGNSGTFKICGTTDGDAVSCSVPDLCNNTINGLEHTSFPINSTPNQQELFCMAHNTAFQLALKMGGSITVVITCQHGQTSSQKDTVTFTVPGKIWFSVNDDCELTQCQ